MTTQVFDFQIHMLCGCHHMGSQYANHLLPIQGFFHLHRQMPSKRVFDRHLPQQQVLFWLAGNMNRVNMQLTS